MRALFVNYTAILGGAERILVDRAAALEGDVAIACPEGLLADNARRAGIRVEPLRARRFEVRVSLRDRVLAPFRLAAQALEIRRLVRREHPQVAFAWGMRSLISTVGALIGLRPRPELVFQHNEPQAGPLVMALARAAARRTSVVSCLSRTLARQLDPSGRLRDRVRVDLPGVDVERFAAIDPAPFDPPRAIYLGALVEWKRPELALDAVGLAARELEGLKLGVVGEALAEGDGSLVESLHRRAGLPDLEGRVEFEGPVGDPREALGRASCLLHCSDCEPFGMVLIEAMAAGLPIVAPGACGPTEIVDESCGSLYPPGDARAAADALVSVLSDPDRARAMGAAGRERARSEFGLEQSLERYRELLEQLAPLAPAPG